MEYFATFNSFNGSINENILIAIKHYDILAMLVIMIILGCIISLIAIRMNFSTWLNNIERQKIYNKVSE